MQSKDHIPIVDKRGYGQTAAGSRNGQPVPFDWAPECQSAFDTIRNYLFDGAHLAPVDYRLPLHCGGGDTTEDGKSFGLWQFVNEVVKR